MQVAKKSRLKMVQKKARLTGHAVLGLRGRGDLELGNLENEQLQTPAPPTLVTSCSRTPRGSNRGEWAQESRIEGMMTTGIVARLLLFLLLALGRRGRLGCAAHAGAGRPILRPTPLLLPGNVLQLKPRLLDHALIEAVPRVGEGTEF